MKIKEKDLRQWGIKEKISIATWVYKQGLDLPPDYVVLANWPFRCGKSYLIACMCIANFLRELGKTENERT